MLSELGIYETRLDRLDAGLPPFSLVVGADGLVPTLVDASTLEECRQLLDDVLRRIPRSVVVVVEDLVSGKVYRGECLRVRGLLRSRTVFDTML